MHLSLPASTSAALVVAFARLALSQGSIVVDGNDDGFAYRATLPEISSDEGDGAIKISGYVQAQLNELDNSTELSVVLENIPAVKGSKILYSINSRKIKDGDCDSAGPAIDPNVGVMVQTLGDEDAAEVEAYEDSNEAEEKTITLKPGDDNFIGDRSFVLQFDNMGVIACANFELRGKPPPELSESESESKGPKSSDDATATGTGSKPSEGSDSEGKAATHSASTLVLGIMVCLCLFGW